jgi:site-specific recombinase XerD
MIHLRGAKGKNDRYTLLSDNALNMLRDYYKQYKPKDFLFEGQGAEALIRKKHPGSISKSY